jgi:hypothetical protein
MTTVYMVVAGNIIDDYNEINEYSDNVIELFDNPNAAEIFGSLFDFYSVTRKVLRSAGLSNFQEKITNAGYLP